MGHPLVWCVFTNARSLFRLLARARSLSLAHSLCILLFLAHLADQFLLDLGVVFDHQGLCCGAFFGVLPSLSRTDREGERERERAREGNLRIYVYLRVATHKLALFLDFSRAHSLSRSHACSRSCICVPPLARALSLSLFLSRPWFRANSTLSWRHFRLSRPTLGHVLVFGTSRNELIAFLRVYYFGFVCCGSSIYVTWLIHVCDVTHSYMRHMPTSCIYGRDLYVLFHTCE